MYDPKADRFNPNAVRDAIERHKAKLRAAGKPVPGERKDDTPDDRMKYLTRDVWLNQISPWRRHG